MKLWRLTLILACLAGMAGAARGAEGWKVPAVTRKFPNGLVVVVSEDHSAPTFGLCISYRIGFRLEPQGRTGFAHLFEHMMFEGTPDAPKGTFDRVIEGGGGSNNADTRYDFTEYLDIATRLRAGSGVVAGGRPHEEPGFRPGAPGKPAQSGGGGSARQRAERALWPFLRH